MEALLVLGFGTLAVVFVLVLQLDARVRKLEEKIKVLDGEPAVLETPVVQREPAPEVTAAPIPVPMPKPPAPAPEKLARQKPEVSSAALMDRAVGVLGIGALVLGVGLGAFYAGLSFNAFGRFLLLVAGAGGLFCVGLAVARKETWKELGLWLRSAGGALFLLAALGAGGIDGLRWVTSEVVGYALLGLGLAVNIGLGLASRRTPILALHQILGLVALALAPKNDIALLAASLVTVSGVVLAGWRKSPGALVAGALAFTVYLLFWSHNRDGVPQFFSVESVAFVLVYGGGIGVLAYRNENFADGGRVASILLAAGSLVLAFGGILLFRDPRVFAPVFTAVALMGGSALALRRKNLPSLYADALGSLVLFSGLAALASLLAWENAVPSLVLALATGAWTLTMSVLAPRWNLVFTRSAAAAVLPWLTMLLLPALHTGLAQQLAHPVLLLLPALGLASGSSKKGESLYFQTVGGLAFLFGTLQALDRFGPVWGWIVPLLWIALVLVSDARKYQVMSSIIAATFFLSAFLGFAAFSDVGAEGLDLRPYLFMAAACVWWMGRGAFHNKRWISTLVGAVVFLPVGWAALLPKMESMGAISILMILGTVFVAAEAVGPLLRKGNLWRLDDLQLRVWRFFSETVVLFWALLGWLWIEWGGLSEVLWLWGAGFALAAAVWRLQSGAGGERLTFGALCFLGLWIGTLLPGEAAAALWLGLAAVTAFSAWRPWAFSRNLGSASVGVFYLGLLVWLRFPWETSMGWVFNAAAVAAGLGFATAAVYGKTLLPLQYAVGSAVIPLVAAAGLVLGLSVESGAPTLILLVLGLCLYLLALKKDGQGLRVTAFITLAVAALRLLVVDFSEGDLGVRALVFLVSGGVLTGLSFVARAFDRRNKTLAGGEEKP